VIAELERRMREAAADLEFETAARLRDEIKRLRETELAVADDPLARQSDVEERAGAYGGSRKYGKAPRGGSPSPRLRGEGRGEGQVPRDLSQAPAPHPNPLPLVKDEGERERSRIQREYQPVQPTYAQTTTRPAPGSRVRKPSLDDMGPGTDRPVPARDPKIDRRAKVGAFGEGVSGPHKPTLDEMGPHAERGLPVGGKPLPPKPVRTIDVPDDTIQKGKRRGRPKKTGRPGQ
jgi:excinuclease ABC subunit B